MENRLYQSSYLAEILKKFNFSFSKSLGQNFLIDGNIVKNIVEKSGITKDDIVLEIGPGFGTLTEELALNAKKVISIEKDHRLMEVLDYTLQNYDNVKIINEDFLKTDLEKIFMEEAKGQKLKVVANLPYYITTPILERIIENKKYFSTISVMVQEEVARRVVASPNNKDYGSLTLYLKYNCESEILMKVPRTVFMPSPNVDSAILYLKLVDRDFDVDEGYLFKFIRSGFTKRRKNIMNSLSTGFVDVSKAQLKEILSSLELSGNLRAENLSLEDYINITKKYTEMIK
ncbi:16S rRNA (adenine(1518)-N(6)/adenine(1519)-N(6))-dimethyltransferase RsmA [Mediannikoviicoccus vaginalis]|uniref:16S rRNA (adenine(1518)-N(6)/adenine(1519)-N(6))- dimethyltransferase RsmA n=1 Tax=Mediannikoviicoccus vaginalis TaxID=2899727 RepID=UPI001F02A7B3|nr:16S rRNA (adenine(1518)-N(6)/adenine(1519)-N(6))-dimethyltransferase RsmA [Mediannikoviicoccus vaginalis]